MFRLELEPGGGMALRPNTIEQLQIATAKALVALLILLVQLCVVFAMFIGRPSHWPYGSRGQALHDAFNNYVIFHAALIVPALLYLAWRRLTWASVRDFALASLLVVSVYFVFQHFIWKDIQEALSGG